MPEGLNWLGWIVIGFIAGAVAGWFVPGHGRMGCMGTTVVGIIGGLLGGWFWTNVLNQNPAGGFLGAILIAILGSAFVLVVLRGLSRD
ncbi:MAG TPA: GlsB/YeaQ/YmgE family stress response membrane protein [Candidatus Limnocylindria bacterium]